MNRREVLALGLVIPAVLALPALAETGPERIDITTGWRCRRAQIDNDGLAYIVWYKMTDEGYVVHVQDPRALLRIWNGPRGSRDLGYRSQIQTDAIELLTPWARVGNNVHVEIRKSGVRYDTNPTILAENFIRRPGEMLSLGVTLGYHEIRRAPREPGIHLTHDEVRFIARPVWW